MSATTTLVENLTHVVSPPSVISTSSVPPAKEWIPPEPTNEEVEWADILTVDLSLYDTKKQELIDTVQTALERDGFFYVIGHGIPEEILKRQFNIGQ
ncbi:hypothetical protein D9758_018039 [Tetrapyrgos nigripes]|uniref:Non-haem dioxygenase N-terminal domain-containing protein n=1 Tax=Tetrapyrgos nigripes TaxID=182062 RepID=A0A8H5EYY4_9AGAR|nr:hypothetical protein D9758_018039 [Tetrapyrgos nigripes]